SAFDEIARRRGAHLHGLPERVPVVGRERGSAQKQRSAGDSESHACCLSHCLLVGCQCQRSVARCEGLSLTALRRRRLLSQQPAAPNLTSFLRRSESCEFRSCSWRSAPPCCSLLDARARKNPRGPPSNRPKPR